MADITPDEQGLFVTPELDDTNDLSAAKEVVLPDVPKYLMPSNVYDVLKWVGLILCPALATFVSTVGPEWGIENVNAIVTTINATGQTLTVVAWNDSETNYDYVTLSELDGTVTRNSSKSCKGTTPSSPKTFTYDLGGAQHTVQVMYSKDGSGDNNSDAGYFYAYVD